MIRSFGYAVNMLAPTVLILLYVVIPFGILIMRIIRDEGWMIGVASIIVPPYVIYWAFRGRQSYIVVQDGDRILRMEDNSRVGKHLVMSLVVVTAWFLFMQGLDSFFATAYVVAGFAVVLAGLMGWIGWTVAKEH